MTRLVVGVCVAVHEARYGPWDQDVAMVPATMVTAIEELGWLALLLASDDESATAPDQVVRLVDGLVVPDWAPEADRCADLSRRLGEVAQARGLPVVRIGRSLLVPSSTVADYRHAIHELFTRDARVGRA